MCVCARGRACTHADTCVYAQVLTRIVYVRIYAQFTHICTGAHAHIRVYAQVLARIVEIEVYDWAVLWVIFLVIYLGSQV